MFSGLEGHAEGSIVTIGQHGGNIYSTPLSGPWFVYILEVGTRRPTSPPVGSPRPVLSKILLTKSEVCPATGDATARMHRDTK